jgi:hypothetical protein
MFRLLETKFFSQWRGRSSSSFSGAEPAMDTSAPLGGVSASYVGWRRSLR